MPVILEGNFLILLKQIKSPQWSIAHQKDAHTRYYTTISLTISCDGWYLIKTMALEV